MLSIGDEVVLPTGQRGVLRWTGRIRDKTNEFAGVELTGQYASQGKHSGEFNGHSYFKTLTPGSGVFVTYSKLVGSNVQTSLSRLSMPRAPASAMSPSPNRGSQMVQKSLNGALAPPPATPSRQRATAEPSSRAGSRATPQQTLHASSRASGAATPQQRPHSQVSKTSATTNPSVIAESEGPADYAELEKLRKQVADRDSRIVQLKTRMEDKRAEFRSMLAALEEDRDSMAEKYEKEIEELRSVSRADHVEASPSQAASRTGPEHGRRSSNSHTELAAELELQKSALAAMQNRMLEEHAELREQLEAALADAETARAEASAAKKSSSLDDTELLMREFEEQEQVLRGLQGSHTELRQRNADLEHELNIHKSASDEKQELLAVQAAEINRLKEIESSVNDESAAEDAVRIRDLTAVNEELKAQLVTAQQAADSAEQRISEERAAHAKTRRGLEAELRDLRAAQENVTSQDNELVPNAEDYKALETALEEHLVRETELELTIEKLSAELQDLRAKEVTPTKPAAQASLTSAPEAKGSIPLPSQVNAPPPLAPPPALSLERPSSATMDTSADSDQSGLQTPVPYEESDTSAAVTGSTAASAGLPSVTGALKIDPAAGRENWCGLCERHGHTALVCPYDDD